MLYLPCAPWAFYNEDLGLISLSIDWENWITIADRDLWAGGVWQSWKLYQRWNNYGFSTDKSETTTSSKTDASTYWPSNYYSSNVRCTASAWESSDNRDLWWNTTWTNVAMRWPCPEWFHIMTRAEADTLLEITQAMYNASKVSDIKRPLKMQARWYAYYSSRNMSSTSYAYYRTPEKTSANYARYMRFLGDTVSSSTMYISYGMFIRPVKDTPIIPVENTRRQICRLRTIDGGSVNTTPANRTIDCNSNLIVVADYSPSNADCKWVIQNIQNSHLTSTASWTSWFSLSPNYIWNGDHTFTFGDLVSQMATSVTYHQRCTLPSTLTISKNILQNSLTLTSDTTAALSFNDQWWCSEVSIVMEPTNTLINITWGSGGTITANARYPWYRISCGGTLTVPSWTQVWDLVWTITSDITVVEWDWTTTRTIPYSENLYITDRVMTFSELSNLASANAILTELQRSSSMYYQQLDASWNMADTYSYNIDYCCEVIVDNWAVFEKDWYYFVYNWDWRMCQDMLTAQELSQLSSANDIIAALNINWSESASRYLNKFQDEGTCWHGYDYGYGNSVDYVITLNNIALTKDWYWFGYSWDQWYTCTPMLTYSELIALPDSPSLWAHWNIETIIDTINNFGFQDYFNALQSSQNANRVTWPTYDYYSWFALTDSNGNLYVVETWWWDYQTIVTFDMSNNVASSYTYNRTLSTN